MPLPPLSEPDDRTARLAGLARALPIVGSLFPSLIAVNGAQTASLVLRPFSRKAFRSVNRWLANEWWGWCVSTAKALYGTRIVVTGDDLPEREDAVVIVNHQDMADITFLQFLARQKGRLGDMKYFVKDVFKYVPGAGWGLLFLDSVFLQRNWLDDQATIEATFDRLTRDEVPVWLISFAEGTRVSPEKVARSQAYARKKGLPELRHVLLPRTKGFVASVSAMRRYVGAVYDVTIGYEGGVPNLWQYIQGFSRTAHLHCRRWPIDALPTDDEALAEWLVARYSEKDALLHAFYRDGRFPSS